MKVSRFVTDTLKTIIGNDPIKDSVLTRSDKLNKLYLFNAITVKIENAVIKVEVTGMAGMLSQIGKMNCVIIPQRAGTAMPSDISNDWYL